MRMDDNADAKRILLASPPADWRRQLGRPRITWLSTVQQDLKPPPYAPRSSRFGSELPSVEDDVDVWRYAIVSCTPETTTTLLSNAEPLHYGYVLLLALSVRSFVCSIKCVLVGHWPAGPAAQ